MSYAKILPDQTVLDVTPVSDEYPAPERVMLGAIVTNYPVTGDGWVPEYSTEHYATLSPAETGNIPPAHKVRLGRKQYLHDHINKYWGAKRPE